MPTTPLPAGTPAPPFSLPAAPGTPVSFAGSRGRPVVLVFYPADWSPVCGDQLALYNALRSEWDRLDTEVIGISVDGPWCHAAYREARNLKLTLLADFEPKGEVARRYGVYDQGAGTCQRALFVLDAEGTIRWSYVSPTEVNPGVDGILDALEALPQPAATIARSAP